MTAHTPGPWFTKAYADERFVEIKARDGYSLVATVHFNGGDRDANARLIAAAPDLLSALQTAELVLRERGLQCIGEYKQIESAIAKAMGEP